MLPRRLHRLITASVAVLSLLFSQLALASYDCPQQARADRMAAMVAAGQPCDGMDPQQPALCHEHCADAASTVAAVKVPLAAPPMVVQVIELAWVLDARQARAAPPTASFVAPAPPDPLFLSTLRLRV